MTIYLINTEAGWLGIDDEWGGYREGFAKVEYAAIFTDCAVAYAVASEYQHSEVVKLTEVTNNDD